MMKIALDRSFCIRLLGLTGLLLGAAPSLSADAEGMTLCPDTISPTHEDADESQSR